MICISLALISTSVLVLAMNAYYINTKSKVLLVIISEVVDANTRTELSQLDNDLKETVGKLKVVVPLIGMTLCSGSLTILGVAVYGLATIGSENGAAGIGPFLAFNYVGLLFVICSCVNSFFVKWNG